MQSLQVRYKLKNLLVSPMGQQISQTKYKMNSKAHKIIFRHLLTVFWHSGGHFGSLNDAILLFNWQSSTLNNKLFLIFKVQKGKIGNLLDYDSFRFIHRNLMENWLLSYREMP